MTKQSAINLLAQVVMFGVNLCISFFLVPYITEVIGVDAYGFVGLANDFVSYAQIVTVAINSMASRFITIKIHEGDKEEANKFYSSVVIANIILSVILGIIGMVFVIFMQHFINVPSDLLLDVKLLFVLIFANFIISILTSTFSVATFCTNKLYLSSIKTIISQIIRVIILLGAFLLLKPSVFYIGLASIVSTAYLGYCNYRYSKELTPDLVISRKHFDLKHIKTLLSSGIWNTFSKLSNILSSGLDLLISNIFIGSVSMGIISVSKTIPNTILNAFGTITSVFTPELTISYAKKDTEAMKHQLLFAVKLLGIFSALPIAILFAYGDVFYTLWVPEQNATLLHYLTCVSVLGLCISLPLEPLWNIFTVTNKVKNSSLFLFMNSALTIIIVFILLNIFENPITRMFIIVGVSICFSIIRSLTFLPLYGAKCVNIKLTAFYPTIFKNLLVIAISTLISLGIKHLIGVNSWLTLIIAAILTCIISIIISTFITINKNDRIKIEEMIKRRFKKKGTAV